MTIDLFKPGRLIGPLKSGYLSIDNLKEYSSVSQDLNPIHLDKSEAIKAGFDREVVHGMLVMGLGHTILSSHLNNKSVVKDYKIKFISPVYVAERLVFTYIVKECNQINHEVTFDIEGKNEKSVRILLGYIILRFMK